MFSASLSPRFMQWLRQIFVPLILIIACPPTVFLFWYTNVALDGSFTLLGDVFSQDGVFATIKEVWLPYFFGSPTAWKILAVFGLFELFLMRFLPGKTFYGPITPAGNIPVYKANGPLAYGVTLAAFVLGGFYFKLFPPSILYDHFPELLGALNFFSFAFCIFLLIKGRFFPSTPIRKVRPFNI